MPKRRQQPKRKSGKRITPKRVQRDEQKPFVLPTVAPKAEVEDEGWDREGMTLKQRLFVEYYMGEAAGVATVAAEKAGYKSDNRDSLKVTASKLLTLPNVQRFIERRIGERFGSKEDVRNSIAAIANGNAADYLEPDANGEMVLSTKKMAEAGALGLIHEMREEGIKIGDAQAQVTKRKVKMYDRLRALELLAKMNGQLKDQVEHTGSVQVVKVLKEVSMDEL